MCKSATISNALGTNHLAERYKWQMSPSVQPTPTLLIVDPPHEAQTMSLETGAGVREACREGSYTTTTSGLAPTYLQANLIILPSRYAHDFCLLCARNPVPCPLLAESAFPGSYESVKSWIAGIAGDRIFSGGDIRRDVPKYMVYKDSRLIKFQCDDVVEEWTKDHIAFLIGCSYSFESALTDVGLSPPHTVLGRVNPMYRTNIPLCPAGVFVGSTYVVSMRSYKKSDIEIVRSITRPYTLTHGEPIAWGWDSVERLGIEDIDVPSWGDAPLTSDGRAIGELYGDDENVPIFHACGVTPQEAIMTSGLDGTIMVSTVDFSFYRGKRSRYLWTLS